MLIPSTWANVNDDKEIAMRHEHCEPRRRCFSNWILTTTYLIQCHWQFGFLCIALWWSSAHNRVSNLIAINHCTSAAFERRQKWTVQLANEYPGQVGQEYRKNERERGGERHVLMVLTLTCANEMWGKLPAFGQPDELITLHLHCGEGLDFRVQSVGGDTDRREGGERCSAGNNWIIRLQFSRIYGRTNLIKVHFSRCKRKAEAPERSLVRRIRVFKKLSPIRVFSSSVQNAANYIAPFGSF